MLFYIKFMQKRKRCFGSWLGCIAIRVNIKNKKTPPPKIIKFYANGEMTGIRDYVSYHQNNDLGL